MTKNTGVTEAITIPIEEYNMLRNSALWEEALDSVGVDNWEGYNNAISLYQEWKMTNLKEYTNGGFELNEPDYIINGINFAGTCGGFPEQYDCYIVDTEGKKLQVGYVRLRWGNLSCDFPDVGGELICGHSFVDGFKGCFDSETERLNYLDIVSISIRSKLMNIGVIND